MAVTGKTGADAISVALKHICKILSAYNLKLRATVTAAKNAGAITATQETQINAFLDIAAVTCAAFEALAAYSGF